MSSDGTDGVPGEEPEPTVLTNDTQNALYGMAVSLLKFVTFVLLPPLYLYRGRPILERLAKWRWIYALSAIAGIALTIVTANLSTLLVIPIFHLLLIAMALSVAEALLSGGSLSLLTTGIVAVTGVVAIILAVLSTWETSESDVETDKVHLNPSADEYVIPMTEVWKNGGKHDD